MTVKSCNKCRTVKPTTEFHRKARGSEVRRSTCKSCHNLEALESSYVSRHGMTRSDVTEMALDQGGCAICGTSTPGQRGWHMDHNHQCANCTKRRGSCASCRRDVLCSRCNTAIGLLQDSPEIAEAAALYLRNWKGHPGEAS